MNCRERRSENVHELEYNLEKKKHRARHSLGIAEFEIQNVSVFVSEHPSGLRERGRENERREKKKNDRQWIECNWFLCMCWRSDHLKAVSKTNGVSLFKSFFFLRFYKIWNSIAYCRFFRLFFHFLTITTESENLKSSPSHLQMAIRNFSWLLSLCLGIKNEEKKYKKVERKVVLKSLSLMAHPSFLSHRDFLFFLTWNTVSSLSHSICDIL